MPAGFCVAPVPSAEALVPGSAAGAALVGSAILFNWEGVGWCQGRITRQNADTRVFLEDGDVANFFAYYEVDGQEAAHILERSAYGAAADAEHDSWVLLRALD